jgi:hypothetical protein
MRFCYRSNRLYWFGVVRELINAGHQVLGLLAAMRA